MSLKPDYGLYLTRQGFSKSVRQFFYSFPIDHISLIDNTLFSTMNDLIVDGVEYAASFDFEISFLQQVLELAPVDSQIVIMGEEVLFE